MSLCLCICPSSLLVGSIFGALLANSERLPHSRESGLSVFASVVGGLLSFVIIPSVIF
jgi:hypothetical protein